MKSLLESIFSKDLVTNDPFESILEHLDPKKYGKDVVISTVEQLYDVTVAKSGEYSFLEVKKDRENDNKLKKFDKLCNVIDHFKEEYIMILRDDTNHYVLGWVHTQGSDVFDRWCVSNVKWFLHPWSWSTNSLFRDILGIHKLVLSCINAYESCVFITDKKQIKDIKKRIKELSK